MLARVKVTPKNYRIERLALTMIVLSVEHFLAAIREHVAPVPIPAQVSIFDAADILGVSVWSIHRAIKKGWLTGTRPRRRGPGNFWMIDTASLNAVDVSVEYHATAATRATIAPDNQD
jgi:hypothetical protein